MKKLILSLLFLVFTHYALADVNADAQLKIHYGTSLLRQETVTLINLNLTSLMSDAEKASFASEAVFIARTLNDLQHDTANSLIVELIMRQLVRELNYPTLIKVDEVKVKVIDSNGIGYVQEGKIATFNDSGRWDRIDQTTSYKKRNPQLPSHPKACATATSK